MACAAARATLSFHLPQLSPPKSRNHFSKLSFLSIHKPQKTHLFSLHSIDVSREDKTPTLSDSTQTNPPTESPPEEEEEEEEEPEFDKRRLEEKFAVLNTGIYECRSCGYKYDEAVGDPSYPLPPGFQFDKLPDDWRCPTCGAAKSFFESKSVEIAGFAQNQQYGLGGNALTSGQKTILIYGTLLFFFVLFLSGYVLQ
jgi:rubredoxin